MRPDSNSRRLLAVASAKSKMWEFSVPLSSHIAIPEQPSKVLALAIGSLGDFAAALNGEASGSPENLIEKGEALRFASRFFDTLVSSRLNEALDPYDTLCASASYYLCDMPGSSRVMARALHTQSLQLEAGGTERLLLALLKPDPADDDGDPRMSAEFAQAAEDLLSGYCAFRLRGARQTETIEAADSLRRIAYASGSSRELLFVDAAAAVLRRRLEYSVWTCLPKYTGLAIERWQEVALKPSFLREFWPAQRRLGEAGVLRGGSAVVQMPTSAGKTKAIELVVRGAFLSGRTSLAVVVAPFRALCHEISADLRAAFAGENTRVDELSDVLQKDFDALDLLEGSPHVLVLTPEKLHYVVRHHPELTGHVGLVIYDEGHLFDDGSRGVNYELLLASIKSGLPQNAQVLLVSAVMGNADRIRQWLVGEQGTNVVGHGLSPTDRSVAFASWEHAAGQIQFVNPTDSQRVSFFVPRVIEEHTLGLRGRERTERVFPDRSDPKDIALYLGIKLVPAGSVALFCGRKDTASGICTRVVDCFDRNLGLAPPASASEPGEVSRLALLHAGNLGDSADLTRSARLGVYAHHGAVPHGIRLAVEHAMQNGLIRFVVCTSTLAQGVNLPIRYLIVAGVYQGAERIRVRDFQNLMGRAGRAGMHTEGTLLFSDPRIYDKRRVPGEDWRWQAALELLDPEKGESCESAINQVLEPVQDDRRRRILKTTPLHWAQEYLRDPYGIPALARALSEAHEGFGLDHVEAQLSRKAVAIRAIQSYLFAHSDEWLMPDGTIATDTLAHATLAFFLADEDGKEQIRALFLLLAEHLAATVPDATRRTAFGRTLLGLSDCVELERWVVDHLAELLACPDVNSLLPMLWPVIAERITNRAFRNCIPEERLHEMGKWWVAGQPFDALFGLMRDVRIGTGPRPRRCTLNHVVGLCENALGYEGSLLVGAIAEMADLHGSAGMPLLGMLATLQRRLKYGLPGDRQVLFYELGFADRPLAQALGRMFGDIEPSRSGLLRAMRERRDGVETILATYPSFFRNKLGEVLR